jgi:hypothetical protein
VKAESKIVVQEGTDLIMGMFYSSIEDQVKNRFSDEEVKDFDHKMVDVWAVVMQRVPHEGHKLVPYLSLRNHSLDFLNSRLLYTVAFAVVWQVDVD